MEDYKVLEPSESIIEESKLLGTLVGLQIGKWQRDEATDFEFKEDAQQKGQRFTLARGGSPVLKECVPLVKALFEAQVTRTMSIHSFVYLTI